MKKEVDLSLYQFTEEEKLIIEHEKELLKEKRKLFFITTMMMTICLSLLVFQLILLFRFVVGRTDINLVSITSFLLIAIVAVPLIIFTIIKNLKGGWPFGQPLFLYPIPYLIVHFI